MKKVIFILSLLLFVACSKDKSVPTNSGGGQKENFTERYNANLKFFSTTLKREIYYSVLLPEGYNTDDKSKYGVVYLLHGWGGDQSSWGPASMNIQPIIDLKSASGAVRPLIYVMPQGFNSYYCNKYDGSFDYMKMFIKELVLQIDSRFKTTATASQRAVVGFSMGGFGALALTSLNRDTFGVCVGLSPSLNTDSQYKTLSNDGWNLQWGSIFGGYGTTGESRLTAYYKQHSPLHLFEDRPSSDFAGVYYFIDCGDDEERLSVGNGALHLLMRDKHIDHEYRVRDGAHTEGYWRESMLEALPFIEMSFSKLSYPAESNYKYQVNNLSKSETLKIGDLSVDIILPKDYSASSEYKVLYCGVGDGAAQITTSDVGNALDSLLGVRKFIIAGFSPKAAKQANISFSTIYNLVENSYSVQKRADGRLALSYGKDADYLYAQTCGQNRPISYFYAVDADCGAEVAAQTARFYFIDVADNGTNYVASQALYERCRASGSEHQFRVRNGGDTKSSICSGVYSLSLFLGQFMDAK